MEAATSLALPQVPVQEIPQVIETQRPNGRRAMRQAIRDWASQSR